MDRNEQEPLGKHRTDRTQRPAARQCLSYLGLLLLAATGFVERSASGDEEMQRRGRQPVPFHLRELQQRTFGYFWRLTDPRTGLVPDRYPTHTFSSIAAIGFGLSAYVVGAEEGYVRRDEAAERTAHDVGIPCQPASI